MFVCKRCQFSTDTKCILVKHLQRKKPCISLENDISREQLLSELTDRGLDDDCYKCNFCNKPFRHQSARSRHQTTCKQSKKEKEICVTNNTSPVIIGDNNSIVNNTITNNIVIVNPLGKENFEHLINSPDFNNYMVKCMKLQDEGIVQLLTRIHFDPEHPENHNVTKSNKKDNFVQIYDGENWNTRKTNSRTADDILKTAEKIFTLFIENIKVIESGAPKEPLILKKKFIDNFMEVIGDPLGWDLDSKQYTYDGEKGDDYKDKKREEMENLLWESFYQNTKKHLSK